VKIMAKPTKYNGITMCTQYRCVNNTGPCSGKCKIENPDIAEYPNDVWGCGDERYPNEIKKE
jgi:hypothetical protein